MRKDWFAKPYLQEPL